MYGLVVKTSFGVWRLSFMPPHFRVGTHIVFGMVVCLAVCLSVCLSVTKSCPLCNLKTVQDIFIERHRNRRYAEHKNHNSWIYIFELCPFELYK